MLYFVLIYIFDFDFVILFLHTEIDNLYLKEIWYHFELKFFYSFF